MRKLAGLTAAVILVALTATAAVAQQGTAELRGSVTDEQGGALPGVAILITNQDSGTFREVLSGGDGSFFASQMLPGTFAITAQLPGFRTFERTDFAIGVGRTLNLDIVMTIGQLEETITVSGEAPLVDITSAEVGGTITTEDLTELPQGNRSYFSAVALLPGVQFRPSSSLGNDTIIANGQHPGTNNVAVDGSANNDDNSGTAAGGQTRVALESVQEFQVITNQFDAEFGRATGAVVNSITKRGTNEFSGALFNYYTNDGMTAKDYFVARNDALPKPETSKREFGGVIGGPILQDRMHFFFSLERQLVAPGRTPVFPDVRSDLNYTTTESWEAWNSLIRVDHQVNASNSWAFRWLRELAPQYNLLGTRTATRAAWQDETDNDQTYVGSWTSVIGGSKVNTVRLSATREQWWRGNPCWREQGPFDQITAQGSTAQANCPPMYQYQDFQDNQLNGSSGNRDHHWSLSNAFSWFVPDRAGDHDLKFGATYHRTNMLWRDQGGLNGRFGFGGNAPFHRDDFSTYPEWVDIRVGGQQYVPTLYNTLEAYAQDKWGVSDRLTLNLGVRYDLEVFPLENPDNPWRGQFNGGAEGNYPVDYNNFSPRTSFAYDVAGDGRSVVRGGYGIFYDKTIGYQVTRTSRFAPYSDSYVVRFPAAGVDPGPGMGMRPTGHLGGLINTSTTGCPADAGGGCLAINRAYLDQLFPPGTRAVNTGWVFFDHPDRKQSYTHQLTFGYERELTSVLSASVDFVSMHGRDRQMLMEARPQVRDGMLRADPVTRMDALALVPGLNDVLMPGESYGGGRVSFVQNLGTSKYQALNFQLEKRYSDNWQMRAVYSLGKSEGNSIYYLDANWAQVGNDMNIDQLWGPSPYDRRHNVTLSGRTEIPVLGGITVSGVMRYMSGTPFTIHDTRFDPNMNGWGPDPIAAGAYSGEGGTNRNPITVENAGGIRGAYGPEFMQFDIRLGHRTRWSDRQTLDIFFDVFNVTNHGNFNNPTGDMRSSNFLNLTSLWAGSGFPRQAQFGIRWGY